MTEQTSFWDRLAARTKPSGALAVIENPRTVVWMAFLWTLGGLSSALLSAALFFWFDEPVSGWIYVAYALLAAVAWVFFVTTGSVRGTFALLIGAGVIATAAVHVTMGGYANSGAILLAGIAITTVSILRTGVRVSSLRHGLPFRDHIPRQRGPYGHGPVDHRPGHRALAAQPAHRDQW